MTLILTLNSNLIGPIRYQKCLFCGFLFSKTIILASTILITQIREPPDISEANRHRNTGEQEVEFVSPLSSLVLCIIINDVDLRELVGVTNFELDEVVVLLILGHGLRVL